LCLNDGRPSASIAISDRAFRWLFTWASRDIAAGGFKRKRNGAAHADRVFWDYQRKCWVAKYKKDGKWLRREYKKDGKWLRLRTGDAKQSAIQFVACGNDQ